MKRCFWSAQRSLVADDAFSDSGDEVAAGRPLGCERGLGWPGQNERRSSGGDGAAARLGGAPKGAFVRGVGESVEAGLE